MGTNVTGINSTGTHATGTLATGIDAAGTDPASFSGDRVAFASDSQRQLQFALNRLLRSNRYVTVPRTT